MCVCGGGGGGERAGGVLMHCKIIDQYLTSGKVSTSYIVY